MKILVLTLTALLILAGSACFAEEAMEGEPIRDGLQIIQLSDPFEAEIPEDKVQKYFSLDTSYDYEEEATFIWTTLGFRKDVFDISFTWDQQVNPSEPGTATLSINLWW